ncbi:MAG: hypothetical protein R3F20_02140 [Planctomycetota bacterium]
MKTLIACLVIVLVASLGACTPPPPGDSDRAGGPRAGRVLGRLSLPEGNGSRGVEVRVVTTKPGEEPRKVWVLFDERGAFSHDFEGELVRVEVTAGAEIQRRFDRPELVAAARAGTVDLGLIDLREKLTPHHLTLRTADGAEPGVVRAAMWIGLPPVGPMGERVSLGSRQFPPVDLGDRTEWLLPRDAREIYFLVERPSDGDRALEWRGGPQQLFGPYATAGSHRAGHRLSPGRDPSRGPLAWCPRPVESPPVGVPFSIREVGDASMPDPSPLNVGDRVRFVSLPEEWSTPGYSVHPSSRAFMRTLVARGRSSRIAGINEFGQPWIRARLRRRDGRIEYHQWEITEATGWVRVVPRRSTPGRSGRHGVGDREVRP